MSLAAGFVEVLWCLKHGPGNVLDRMPFCYWWNRTISRQARGPIQSWTLSKETVGKECLSQEGINYTWVRETKCRRALVYNDTCKKLPWWPGAPTWYWAPQKGGNGNHTCTPFNSTSGILEQNCTGNQPDTNPFLAIPGISPYWKHLSSTNPDLWQAPEGLFLDLWKKGLLMISIQMGKNVHHRNNSARFLPLTWCTRGHTRHRNLTTWDIEKNDPSS